MYAELAIVFLVRLLVPLSIFRWPLWGGVAALVADLLDIVIITLLPFGDVHNYHQLDKFPDMYYLTIEMIVAVRRWEALPKRIGLALFVWRLAGFVLFELTGVRQLLVFFPNVFESFFLFMGVVTTYATWYKLTRFRLALWLAILGSARLIQEYFLHWRQDLDNVVAVDVIGDMGDATLDWLGDWYGLALPAALALVGAVILLVRGGYVARLRDCLISQLYAIRSSWEENVKG